MRDHLELAYGTTVHGVQGETASSAHMAIAEHTAAASAYVGMTRGSETNIAHLVADNLDEARDQWIAVLGRDRADLGPAHAGELAAQEANRYAQLRPLDQVLAELHRAWSIEAGCIERLTDAEQRRDLLVDIVALTTERDATVPALKQAYAKARLDAENASARAEALAADVCVHAADIARTLQREWDQHRDAARQAAQIVRDGPGRLGQRRAAIRRATEDLAHWSATWQPYLPTMPTRTDDVVRFAERVDDTRRIHAAFERYGRAIAAHARPEYRAAHADADNAVRNRDDAWRAYRDASGQYSVDLSRYGSLAHHDDPAGHLADVEQTITATRAQADEAGDRISSLLAEPTLRTLPADRIESERDTWRVERDARECGRYAGSTQLEADLRVQHSAHEHDIWVSPSAPDQSPSIGR